MNKEIWKDITNYEKKYQISNLGRVKSLDYYNNLNKFKKGNLLSERLTKKGYNTAVIYLNGKPKTFKVHRLVALNFIENIENKLFVNHKDGNKLNNKIENLEWVTHSENIKHAFKNGLICFNKNKERDIKGRFLKTESKY